MTIREVIERLEKLADDADGPTGTLGAQERFYSAQADACGEVIVALREAEAGIDRLRGALAPFVACMVHSTCDSARNFPYPFHGVTVGHLRWALKALESSK
jgi:hypothetical protein